MNKNKESYLHIRISPKEKQKIEEAANKESLRLSDFVRKTLQEKVWEIENKS